MPSSTSSSSNHEYNLSVSPPSVTSPIFAQRKVRHLPHNGVNVNDTVTLDEFIDLIPSVIRNSSERMEHESVSTSASETESETASDTETASESGSGSGSDHDPITQFFRRLQITPKEVEEYAFVEPCKNYTRNLIATDHETYTLLLLCWNPTKCSPIHDHPCNGCWMKVLEGTVNEKRYVQSDVGDHLICTSDCTFRKGEDVFIKDSLGYHKIGNLGNEASMTLHLYSPPISKCRLWMDEGSTSSTQSYMCNFSEYGKRV